MGRERREIRLRYSASDEGNRLITSGYKKDS